MNADYWVKKLNLTAHPEGGFFRETYRCSETMSAAATNGKRSVSTAIYFLLEGNNRSHFHRIQSDELWFFHEGTCIEIFMLDESGLKTTLLGKDAEAGEVFQAVIPAGKWFAARVKDRKGFGLVSCTVAPGFDFVDFELAHKSDLLNTFPEHSQLIAEMTLD